jgi:hypothetical protein
MTCMMFHLKYIEGAVPGKSLKHYKIQDKHDEGKCQYDTHFNNYSRNFSVRQKIFRTDKTNQPV